VTGLPGLHDLGRERMISRIRTIGRRTHGAEDSGASAIEYALLVAAIAAVIVAIVFLLGSRVSSVFNNTQSCISSSGSGC
jgi:pilus assembly protein Flp/PilA